MSSRKTSASGTAPSNNIPNKATPELSSKPITLPKVTLHKLNKAIPELSSKPTTLLKVTLHNLNKAAGDLRLSSTNGIHHRRASNTRQLHSLISLATSNHLSRAHSNRAPEILRTTGNQPCMPLAPSPPISTPKLAMAITAGVTTNFNTIPLHNPTPSTHPTTSS